MPLGLIEIREPQDQNCVDEISEGNDFRLNLLLQVNFDMVLQENFSCCFVLF